MRWDVTHLRAGRAGERRSRGCRSSRGCRGLKIPLGVQVPPVPRAPRGDVASAAAEPFSGCRGRAQLLQAEEGDDHRDTLPRTSTPPASWGEKIRFRVGFFFDKEGS